MSIAVEAPTVKTADKLSVLKDLPLKAHVRLQTEVAERSDPDRERRIRDVAADLTLTALTFYFLTSKGIHSPLQRSRNE